jgi:hypothetical protein
MKSLQEYIQSGRSRAVYKNIRTKEEEMQIAKQSPIFVKLQYKGWVIDPTIHAAAQAYDRRPDFELDDWKKLHRRSVEHIMSQDLKKSGEYLFYSKSLDQAYVTAIDTARKTVRIITVLPKGKNRPNGPTTTQVIVENKTIEIIEFFDIE